MVLSSTFKGMLERVINYHKSMRFESMCFVIKSYLKKLGGSWGAA
jgi:hypothetical protein